MFTEIGWFAYFKKGKQNFAESSSAFLFFHQPEFFYFQSAAPAIFTFHLIDAFYQFIRSLLCLFSFRSCYLVQFNFFTSSLSLFISLAFPFPLLLLLLFTLTLVFLAVFSFVFLVLVFFSPLSSFSAPP